jgi:four helix bundle protein
LGKKPSIVYVSIKSIKKEDNMDSGYKKLTAWQKADDLAYQTYIETKNFPKEEIYGLTSQLRRAVVSIPTNIAEGCGRQNKNEFRHFLNIALGSMFETEYLLGFCFRLNYLTEESYQKLENQRKQIGALLWNLRKSLLTCDV